MAKQRHQGRFTSHLQPGINVKFPRNYFGRNETKLTEPLFVPLQARPLLSLTLTQEVMYTSVWPVLLLLFLRRLLSSSCFTAVGIQLNGALPPPSAPECGLNNRLTI